MKDWVETGFYFARLWTAGARVISYARQAGSTPSLAGHSSAAATFIIGSKECAQPLLASPETQPNWLRELTG